MSSYSSISAETAAPPITISAAEWKIVIEILRRFAAGQEVWAYGSRARGERVKKHSDLDLAIDGSPLSLAALSAIREAFDGSSLPFKVDVVDAASLDAAFRGRIEVDKIVLLPAD
jgi:predicted nucleotidyltransferase